jgi:alpha-L-fucosidase 2
MFKVYLFSLLFYLIFVSGCKKNEVVQLRLYYNNPAAEWTDALPVGNGRIGAMVFGKTDVEHIQLNDDSMWPGSTEWDNPSGTKKDLQEIRNLLFAGKNKEADNLLVKKFSRKSIGRSHQTLGDLFIDLGYDQIKDYKRELSLNDAIVQVSYKSNGAVIKQKVFASYPDQALIIQIQSTAKNGLNGKIRLSRPMDKGHPTVRVYAEHNQLVMAGEVTQRNGWFDSKGIEILHGVKFQTRLLAKNEGGSIQFLDDHIELQNVQKIEIDIVSNTSYYHNDYEQESSDQIAALIQKDFSSLLEAHIKDYQSLYNRVDFKLGENALDSLSTAQRLQRIGDGEADTGLEAILFQYGRYLLISSSRPNTNPANLQGLWNKDIMAPWNADYHMNINLQMNYWLADVTNLAELNQPLFKYIDRLVERGKKTARENFAMRGTFFPHASDLWAPTFLRAETAYWGASFGAAGWMMQHYWQHFKFTRDTSFLRKRAFPALDQAAHFYFDWLVEDPGDGTLISVPSTSPENRYIKASGDTVASCLGSAMDQQIIAEVFDNYLSACQILNINNGFLDSLKVKRQKLRSGLVIGSDGRILEWDREYKEFEKGHRHMSHLYAFHPGDAVSKQQTPELYLAARKTLEYRLEHGGAHTGWSRAWLINLYARLQEGDLAHEHIRQLIKKSMYKNLFDSHPPFQIDGNFGYTAGVAEMLLQSHEDSTIHLLPALPGAWPSGYITGLKARGNFVVDIEWIDNQLSYARITSVSGGKSHIVYKDQIIPIDLKPGESFTLKN